MDNITDAVNISSISAIKPAPGRDEAVSSPAETRYPIGLVAAAASRVHGIERLTFSELGAKLSRCEVGRKDGPGWMPVDIQPGSRAGDRVQNVWALTLDIEGKCEPVKDPSGKVMVDEFGDTVKKLVGPNAPGVDEMQAELELHDWRCILHTTYGHLAELPRYRLGFELSRPLQPSELRPLGLHIIELLGVADCTDLGAIEPARLFYLPRVPSESRRELFRCVELEGSPLPVDVLLAEAGRIAAATAAPAKRRGAQSASVIDAFNAAHDIRALMERPEYCAHHGDRWLHSSSTTGAPGVRLLTGTDGIERVFSSHSGDPLNDDHAHDAFDVFRILEHGGDRSTAVKAAAGLMGMDHKTASGNGATPASTLDAGEWPEPKPITAELCPVPAFDPKTLLPDALCDWVMDEADRMPCPPDYIAAAAIVGLGAIIGARCAIKPKARDAWLIVPNLWGGVVGLPSAKKSPAISSGLKPLDRLIALAMKEHMAALDSYEAAKIVFEAQGEAMQAGIKRAAKSSNGSNGSTLSGLAADFHAHRAAEPEAPTLRRYKSNDSTIEKLGELLRANPAGLLVVRDELVGLIASWDREGREGERAFYLEAWNGTEGFDTDRIGRGSIFIPNLCLSLFGGIQPDKLNAYLEQATHALTNDGMLQRFQLLVYPDHRAWEWRDRAPNKPARDMVHDVFEKLANFNPVTCGAAPADTFTKFPYFRFSGEAQEIFIEWAGNLHRERLPAEDNPIIAQHLTKFDKLFPALALIFHLVDCMATGSSGPVSAEAALRAAAWCEYLEAHARRCYGLLVDDGLRSAQTLAEKVRQGKVADGFTARDVRRNQWRYLTTDDAVRAALEWLEDEHWLRSEEIGGTGPGTGRRTCRYFINPKVAKSGASRG